MQLESIIITMIKNIGLIFLHNLDSNKENIDLFNHYVEILTSNNLAVFSDENAPLKLDNVQTLSDNLLAESICSTDCILSFSKSIFVITFSPFYIYFLFWKSTFII